MTLFIGIVVFILLIIVLLILKSYLDIVNKEYASDEETYKDENSTKKALVLYTPSKHDSATTVKDNLVKKLVSKGFEVKVNFPSTERNYNYEEFDMICYISPVYMAKVSRPMLEMMATAKYRNKKVIIISVGNSNEDKKELSYMKDHLDQQNEFNLIKLKKDEVKKLNDFVEAAVL